MSTKTKTETTQNSLLTAQFDPQGMETYHQGLGQLSSFFNNPFTNPLTQRLAGQQIGDIAGRGRTQMNNLLLAARTGQFQGGNMPAFLKSQQQKLIRSMSAQQSNAWLNAAGFTGQMLPGLIGAARPLQTGSTSNMTGTQTSTQSGLGTWLPQLAGMGLSALTAGLTGGASAAAGAATGAVGAAPFGAGAPFGVFGGIPINLPQGGR